MFFLNLTAIEFFGLLGVLSAGIAALYFLDRTKRKRIVSTLRFWDASGVSLQQRSRKRVNQPVSLLLQLLSLLLLLLAIAQLQIGQRLAAGRSHVLLVDASAWSGARSSAGVVLSEEVQLAKQYVMSLPKQDRVLVAGVDGLVSPLTGFLKDREQTLRALTDLKPHLSSLDLSGAFQYAEHVQTGLNGPVGEIIYVGPARVNASNKLLTAPHNLRVLPVNPPKDNIGIRDASASAVENTPGTWQASVKLYNFGDRTQWVRITASFAGTSFAERSIHLSPRQETELSYRFVTNTAGPLTVKLTGSDSLAEDDQVTFELPGNAAVRVIAYSTRPDVLRPLLESNPRLQIKFESPAQYVSKPPADVVVLDNFAPSQIPAVPSLWFNPPHLPPHLSTKTAVERTAITSWNDQDLISPGLHSREQELTHATIFSESPDYLPFASTAEGPIVMLGKVQPRLVVMGFDPLQPNLRFTVFTPLLFANLMQWVLPASSNPTNVRAEQVGPLTIPLTPGENTDSLKLSAKDGTALPFTVSEASLQLFVEKPMVLHLQSSSRDQVLSLTLPDVAEFTWKPPDSVPTGLPVLGSFERQPLDLWKWLALSGGLGLLIEWLLFGQLRVLRPPNRRPSAMEQHAAHEPAMVSK